MHSNEEKHTLNMVVVNYLSSLSQYMNDCHYLEKKNVENCFETLWSVNSLIKKRVSKNPLSLYIPTCL